MLTQTLDFGALSTPWDQISQIRSKGTLGATHAESEHFVLPQFLIRAFTVVSETNAWVHPHGVLLVWKFASHFSTNCCIRQVVHCMIVGCIQGVTFLIQGEWTSQAFTRKAKSSIALGEVSCFGSNETSAPSKAILFPKTPEKLTMGFACSPTPVLNLAYNACIANNTSKEIKHTIHINKLTFPQLWSGSLKLKLPF